MNSILKHNNGTSLNCIIDITAHNISLFDEANESPQNIKDTFINKSKMGIAEPYDVQIDETCNNFITMYQFIGDINDSEVAGLESLLNYMNENFFSKDKPAVNEHQYHITKNNIMKIYIIFIISIKISLITLRIIDIQMIIIIIKSNS